MSDSIAIRSIIWRSLRRLARIVARLSVAAAVLAALVILLLRYWLLPDVERFHDSITASVTEMVGSTVTIGRIEGDWDGVQPRLILTDVRLLAANREPALTLPRVDSRLSWMSLLSAGLRLDSLEIDHPELLVRRDAQGRLFLGDLSLSGQGGDNNLANWLLHQSRMVVRDARITWTDERRGAPPLVLDKVNLRIQNQSDRHSFSLRALPPAALATPLDVRGDFYGENFDDLGEWQGQVFAQIDHTDVVAWRPWLDLPREFSRGRGALRAWLRVEAGRVAGVTADMELFNVAARLADDAPELALDSLRGRAVWNARAGRIEVSTRNLAIRFSDGTELKPTDLYVRVSEAADGEPASGEVRANLLQLEEIARLASYAPLEAGWRAKLEAHSPRGTIANLDARWRGAFGKLESYSIKGRFQDIGLRQSGAVPGFSGLSLDVEGSETGGRLQLDSRKLLVEAPGVMPEMLAFSKLQGQASWLRQDNEITITLGRTEVVNDELAGTVSGSYQTKAGTRGVLDLTANLTRGDIRYASRYIPLIALGREGNDWLKGALRAGHSEDFRIRIKGNLSDFPLNGATDGVFELGGHAKDAVLEFAKNWPRIEKITGEFSIKGKKMEVKSSAATMAGARLENVVVTIPDMTSKERVLEINGEAAGETDRFLQFIQQSPVRGYLSGLTDGVRASGNGHLKLFVGLPLNGSGPPRVSGAFRLQDSDIDPGKGIPWLRHTSGMLAFTEAGAQASGVSAQILGGASTIDVQTAKGGEVLVAMKGRCDLDALRKSEASPLLDYLHGGAEWGVDISVSGKKTTLAVRSDLRGIRSELPQPFVKSAGKEMELRLEKVSLAGERDSITARLGNLIDARLERDNKSGAMVTRGTVTFGRSRAAASKAKEPPGARRGGSGIWLAGSLPELSIQGWGGLMGGEGAQDLELPIAGADLRIGKLSGYGQAVTALRINASRRGDGLAVRLASDALSGQVTWLPHGYRKGAKLAAQLHNLNWIEDEAAQPSLPPARAAAPAKAVAMRPDRLPAMDVAIENLRIKGKHLGRAELVGHPEGNSWRIRRLGIANPDGALTGNGIWRSREAGTQTQVNFQLKIDNMGNTLARYGYPGTVKDGKGTLAGQLSWAGAPYDFGYASLDGMLKVDAVNGRFLKMDPGAGKLLSILSMQALPSHITLDFNDVFRRGFQFEHISGNAAIQNGVVDARDFNMIGSAARVAMSGTVNLNNETQDLRVRVFPAIGDSVSLISVFAAGPAVGVGALIVSKILGDPLDKLVSFEYNVTGTWSEPVVVQVVQPQPSFE